MPKMFPGGRRINLPPLQAKRPAIDEGGQQLPHIIMGTNPLWVRFSSYVVEPVEEEVIIGFTPSVQTAVIRVLYIRPARGARAEIFRLNDVLDEAVLYYGNNFVLSEKESEELSRELQKNPPPLPDIYDYVEKKVGPVVEECFNRFGPSGIMFDNIWSLNQCENDSSIHVEGLRGKDLGTLEEYFGNYLSRPVSLKILSEDNLVPLFRAYREPIYEVFHEALEFASWSRSVIKAKSPNDPSLIEANKLLRRSIPRLEFVGSELQFVHGILTPRSGRYLNMIDSRLGGRGFMECKSEFCESLFLPTKSRQQYCTPDCATRRRVSTFQERNRNLLA